VTLRDPVSVTAEPVHLGRRRPVLMRQLVSGLRQVVPPKRASNLPRGGRHQLFRCWRVSKGRASFKRGLSGAC